MTYFIKFKFHKVVFYLAFFFICIKINAQEISYFPQYTNEIGECLYEKSDKNLTEHLSVCMINKQFPSFCLEDMKGKEIQSPSINELRILTFLDIESQSSIEEIKFLKSIKVKYPKIEIICFFINPKKDLISKIKSLSLFNFSIVPNSNYEPVPRSQYGLPLTILLDKSGFIKSFALDGNYSQQLKNNLENGVNNLLKISKH